MAINRAIRIGSTPGERARLLARVVNAVVADWFIAAGERIAAMQICHEPKWSAAR
jgi:hypothetical protein